MFKKLLITYLALLTSFTLLLIGVFSIPTSMLRGNIIRSVMQIEDEGLWFKPCGFYLFQIDNMTDCQMLRIDATADSSRPVWAAMMAEQFDNAADTLHPYLEVTRSTLAVAKNGRPENCEYTNYSRYWHGYQVILRPLLLFADYSHIRIINYTALTFLLLFVAYAIYRVLGRASSVSFLISLLATNFFIVPLAIQFSTCFYIAFIAMLLFLLNPKIIERRHTVAVVFFIVGALTAYMDFLTTPLLTLAMPLVTVGLLFQQRKRHHHTASTNWLMIKFSLYWFGGYASLWTSKWLLGYILTGYNILESAVGSAGLRLGSTIVYGGEETTISHLVSLSLQKITAVVPLYALVAAVVLIISACIIYLYTNRKHTHTCSWLLLIAAMPVIWFLVMKNHSLQHIFFTWRDFIVTLWCLLLFVWITIKEKHHENSSSYPLL